MPFSVAIPEEEEREGEEGKDTSSCAYSNCDYGVPFCPLTDRGRTG